MKIGIVDDEVCYRDGLRAMLREELKQMGMNAGEVVSFSSAEAFLEAWRPFGYDLVFLDIFMEGMNGIQLARRLRKKDPEVKIVFVTTSNEFAAESYEVNASFYLKKPYDRDAVAEMIRRLDFSNIQEQKKVTMPDGAAYFLYQISHTIYERHRITLYLVEDAPQSIWMSQAELEERLLPNEGFCKINRGILVNLHQVDRAEKDTLHMNSGDALPISRSQQKVVAETYAKFKLEQLRRSLG